MNFEYVNVLRARMHVLVFKLECFPVNVKKRIANGGFSYLPTWCFDSNGQFLSALLDSVVGLTVRTKVCYVHRVDRDQMYSFYRFLTVAGWSANIIASFSSSCHNANGNSVTSEFITRLIYSITNKFLILRFKN